MVVSLNTRTNEMKSGNLNYDRQSERYNYEIIEEGAEENIDNLDRTK